MIELKGKILVLFGVWLLLAGCADLGSRSVVRTREVTRVATVEVTRVVTIEAPRGLSCTLMGCGNALTVVLDGSVSL